jgi:hypothetical protein
MDHIIRRPSLSIQVVRPSYTSPVYRSATIVTFVPRAVSEDDKAKRHEAASDALLSYSYSESIVSVDSPFTMSVTPEMDKNGLTWLDKISKMDLVFIEEFGKIRYCGVVHDVRYSARMGQDGPSRGVVISGNGFGHLISLFQLVMDYHLWVNGPSAETASQQLKVGLANDSGRKLKATLKIIYDSFITLVTTPDVGEINYGVKILINNYLDLDKGLSDSMEGWYDLAINLYHVGENNIWQIWQSIIPPPIYELFGRWDCDACKYVVFARQSPFDAADWRALNSTMTSVNPLVLTDYDVGCGDSEAKTFFYGEIPGSELEPKETLAMSEYKATRVADNKKWPIYSFRPMSILFRFFNRKSENSTDQVLKRMAETLYNWYHINDELLNGTISLISIDDAAVMKYPTIGTKLSFLGGEFYIEETERSWKYGDSPRTKLTVTRGAIYDTDGSFRGPIKNLGKRLLEFEGKNYDKYSW